MPDLKLTIVFVARDGDDWDITDVLDGRPISDPEVQKDLIEMFAEDLEYIYKNSIIDVQRTK